MLYFLDTELNNTATAPFLFDSGAIGELNVEEDAMRLDHHWRTAFSFYPAPICARLIFGDFYWHDWILWPHGEIKLYVTSFTEMVIECGRALSPHLPRCHLRPLSTWAGWCGL